MELKTLIAIGIPLLLLSIVIWSIEDMRTMADDLRYEEIKASKEYHNVTGFILHVEYIESRFTDYIIVVFEDGHSEYLDSGWYGKLKAKEGQCVTITYATYITHHFGWVEELKPCT